MTYSTDPNGMLLEVESLEPRHLLAGNVTAFITGAGDLVVTGDNADNDLQIDIDGGGNVSITGQNGTTVDNRNLATSTLSGDVRVNLRGGNDKVIIDGGYGNVPVEDMLVIGGAGDDEIRLQGAYGLTGGVRLIAGSGSDRAYVKYSGMSGDLRIISGSGDDGNYVGHVDEARNIFITSATGMDADYLYTTKASGNVVISSTSGDDRVSVMDSYAGYNSAIARSFSVRTGAGNDTVSMTNSHGAPKIVLAGGNDALTMDGHVGTGNANGGGGTDSLALLNDAQLELKYSSFA